jgi:hypothetical protein
MATNQMLDAIEQAMHDAPRCRSFAVHSKRGMQHDLLRRDHQQMLFAPCRGHFKPKPTVTECNQCLEGAMMKNRTLGFHAPVKQWTLIQCQLSIKWYHNRQPVRPSCGRHRSVPFLSQHT